MNLTSPNFPRLRQCLLPALVCSFAALSAQRVQAQADPLVDKLVGDVGGAVYGTQSIIRSKGRDTSVLPYGFVDYGRFFARVDTLGVKTLPMGDGYLELVGRVSQDGWRANTPALVGLTDRKTPLPLGLGTFQKTPYGAFIVNAFIDVNKSRGSLLEATYAAELKLGAVSLYPQVGVEYRSAKYANYLYSVSAVESTASGYASYSAGASTSPVLGLAADIPLSGPWLVTLQLRRRWLDSAVANSPLVGRKTQDMAFAALSYRFK